MRKNLLLALVLAFLTFACGVFTPSAPTPESIQPTETLTAPEQTAISESTLISNPEPYAIVSVEKAEFWFPLPEKEEWQWFVLPKNGDTIPEEYSWSVRFAVDKTYQIYAEIINYNNLPGQQKGSLSDMLETAFVVISELEDMQSDCSAYQCYPTGLNNAKVYSLNGGLQIELTETIIVQALNQARPASMIFRFSLLNDNADPSNPSYETGEFIVTPAYK